METLRDCAVSSLGKRRLWRSDCRTERTGYRLDSRATWEGKEEQRMTLGK